MSIWNYYFVTEQKPVRLEQAERALQAASPNFYIDGDTVVLRDGYEGGKGKEELECGQITIESVADPALLPDREFFEAWIAAKQSRDRLLGVLARTKTLVTVQLLNTPFWWDNEPQRTLRPLQDWLIENFDGVLYVEGGEFYDRQGLVP